MSTTPRSPASSKPWSFVSSSQWNRPPPLGQAPSARCGHTTTKAGPKLYLFGGWSGTKMLSDLYILEPEVMRWSRPTTSGKVPRPRAGHTCTAIGPAQHLNSDRNSASHASHKVLDDSSPRKTDEETPTSPRSHRTASIGSTDLTLVGNTPTTPTNEELLPTIIETNGANAVTNVAPPSQRLLFFGGGDNDGLLNDLYILEIDTLTWSRVFTAGSSPSPRSRHSATLVKSTLWVIGGLGEGQNVFNDVYTLNTTSMVWSKPALKGNPMSPRWGHSAIRSGSLIIIFGGHNGADVMNDLRILDTDSNTWKTIEPQIPSPMPVETTPMIEHEGENSSMLNYAEILKQASNPPSPRCGHSANFLLLGRERKMVVFGGSNTAGKVFNDTIVLDLDSFHWMHLTIKGSLPHERSVHSCNTVDDKLFVIGGIDSTRRFKDIYTLSLSGLVSLEDPVLPLKSSRPRRSSRASPRVALNSPGGSINASTLNGSGPHSPTLAPPQFFPTATSSLPQTHHQQTPASLGTGEQLLTTVEEEKPPASPRLSPNHTMGSPSGSPLRSSNGSHSGGSNSNVSNSNGSTRSRGSSLRRSAGTTVVTAPVAVLTPTASPSSSHPTLPTYTVVPGTTAAPPPSPPSNAGNKDIVPISQFLANLGLSRLTPKFEAEEIDLNVLPYLTEEHLEYLGVNTLGSKLRLSNAISAFKSTSHLTSSSSTSSSSSGNSTAPHDAVILSPVPHAMLASQQCLTSSQKVAPTTSPHALQQQLSLSTSALQAAPLDTSVEKLVSTVLVATNTLTETMQILTKMLNHGNNPLQVAAPTSMPSPSQSR